MADLRRSAMRFTGIIPAVTTPFDENGDIQVAALQDNIQRLLVAGVQGFVAVKECVGETTQHRRADRRDAGRLEVLGGGEDFALEGFCAGPTGSTSGVANVAAAECVQLYDLVNDGDLATAQRLCQRMLPLARLDVDPKLVQFSKAARDRVGFTRCQSCEPRLPLTEAELDALSQALAALGVTRAAVAA